METTPAHVISFGAVGAAWGWSHDSTTAAIGFVYKGDCLIGLKFSACVGGSGHWLVARATWSSACGRSWNESLDTLDV